MNINLLKIVYKSNKNTGNSRKIIIYTILSLIIVFCIGEIVFSKYYFEVTYYNIVSQSIEQKIRILQISDLHNSQFENDSETFFDAIKNLKPDLIILTGDLINSDDTNLNIACKLISNLVSVAPV